MITIIETTTIQAPPEKVWEFLVNLHKDGNYKKWHPKDHILFILQSGKDMGTVDARAYFEERIGKFLLKLSYKTVRAGYPFYLEYEAAFPLSWLRFGKGSFTIETMDGMITKFTAYAEYGYSIPIIGKFIDWIVGFIIKKADAERHIREEGKNLKQILE